MFNWSHCSLMVREFRSNYIICTVQLLSGFCWSVLTSVDLCWPLTSLGWISDEDAGGRVDPGEEDGQDLQADGQKHGRQTVSGGVHRGQSLTAPVAHLQSTFNTSFIFHLFWFELFDFFTFVLKKNIIYFLKVFNLDQNSSTYK